MFASAGVGWMFVAGLVRLLLREPHDQMVMSSPYRSSSRLGMAVGGPAIEVLR